jgi:hypothetical protein
MNDRTATEQIEKAQTVISHFGCLFDIHATRKIDK